MPKLHVNGYTIINNGFQYNNELLNELKKQVSNNKAGYIFNNIKNDRKRLQANLKIKPIIKIFFDEVFDSLKKNNIGNKLYISDSFILKSLPGCQRQKAHADHVLDNLIFDEDFENIPLAVVCAVMDSKIDIWNKSINRYNINKNIKRRTIKLKKGDIFIFRGDFIHAGSAYKNENIRVHFYLDSKNNKHTYNKVHDLKGKEEWEKYILNK